VAKPRYATALDVPRITELAAEEHALSHWAHVPFDAATCSATIHRFIDGHGSTMLVTPGGYLAGLVQPMGFSPRLIAMEYALYSNDGTGLELLRRFEVWSRAMGATQVCIHGYSNEPRLAKVLTGRMKYKALGTMLARDLES
jgi:hypothetical protein